MAKRTLQEELHRIEIYPDRRMVAFTKVTVVRDDKPFDLRLRKKAYRPGDPVPPGILSDITRGLWSAADRIKSVSAPEKTNGSLYRYRGKDG
jgi:hypothetical protein